MNATTKQETAVLDVAQKTDTVGTALAEVSTSNQKLTELAAVGRDLHTRFKDVAFEVSTTKGMEEAKKARAQIRDEARYPMQALKEAGSKMLGQMQRQFNARAQALIDEVEGYETPIDAQIKAEETRKAAEKAAKEAAEQAARAAIQERIDAIRNYVVIPAGVKAAGIYVSMQNLQATEITIDAYGDRAGEAANIKADTLAKLEEMHAAAQALEAEQARMEAEREELARQRAEQEARDKAERERLAAQQKADAAKLAAERAEFEKEQAAARAEAKAREDADRARRDEEDRKAREARAAEDKRIADARAALEAEQRAIREAEEAKAAAARKAEQDALDAAAAAERKRLDDEAAARREAQRLEYEAEVAAERAQERVCKAGPVMLTALKAAHHMLCRDFIDDAKSAVIDQCSAAIFEATGEEA